LVQRHRLAIDLILHGVPLGVHMKYANMPTV
jgi:hypothetical protein